MKTTILIAALLLAGCASAASETTATADSPPAPTAPCGASTQDWCPSPEGDACGEHADEASCRADPQCVGMPYIGESFVPCEPDGKGFWKNCPAVGCISKPAAAPK